MRRSAIEPLSDWSAPSESRVMLNEPKASRAATRFASKPGTNHISRRETKWTRQEMTLWYGTCIRIL